MITRGAVILAPNQAVDVTDRAGRLLGKVDLSATGANATAIKVDNSAVTQPVSIAAAVDVSDRAARLLGVAKLVDTGGTNQLAITAANAAKVDGSAVTQPVSLTGNQAVNVAQIAGTATDVGSGNKGLGTQRVVIANDQPQLINALKVDGSAVTQPVSGSVSALGRSGTTLPQDTDGTLLVKTRPNLDTANAEYVYASQFDMILLELRRMNLLMAQAFGIDLPDNNDVLDEGYAA